jgi:molybdopterin/thiamine biosynthesis adenylyltransferase
MNIDTTRQSGIIPDGLINNVTVAVVGVGAIGSHTTEALTKMGVRKIRIFDDDTVEVHNLANQGYFGPEIGYKKVEALANRLSIGTGAEIIGEFARVEDGHIFEETFVVSAVDNMSSRKSIFDSFLTSSSSRFFIDGRMAARFGQVFFVDKSNRETIEKYENSLFSDDEAMPLPCTEKATIFCAYGMASLICSLVAKSIICEPIQFYAAEIDFANMRLNQSV